MLNEVKHLGIAGKTPLGIKATYRSLARSFAAAQADRETHGRCGNRAVRRKSALPGLAAAVYCAPKLDFA